MNAQTEIIESKPFFLHKAIAEHPFFKGINPQYLHLLTDCATHVQFGAEQDIFREREEADHFYLIQTGHVDLNTFIPRSGLTRIQTLGPGEPLGWSWLFPPYEWHLNAHAAEPVEAISFDAARLRESAEENHDFGYDLAMRVGRLMLVRLQATRRRLMYVCQGDYE